MKAAATLKQPRKGKVEREMMQADQVLPPEAAAPYAPEAVTAQYWRAISGALEMVRFGAMLLEIETGVSRVRLRCENGQLAGQESGLKAWLADNCPDVNYKTAMRFKALAEGVRRYCNVPAKVPLALAMPGADGEPVGRDAKLAKLQRSVWALCEGRSARQLQFAFGADAAPRGGDRRSGLKMSEEEKHLKHLEDCRQVWLKLVGDLSNQVSTFRSHLCLDADTLTHIVIKLDTIRAALKEAKGTVK